MKRCTKCGIEKDEGEFSKAGKGNRHKDGLRAWCKECFSIYTKKYYRNKKSKILLNAKKRYLRGRTSILKSKKQDRKNNPEKYRQIDKVAYQKNRDKNIKRVAEWIKLNPDKYLKYQSKIHKKAREAVKINYLKRCLVQQGFTREEIKKMPFLLDKKKLDIFINRSKKLLKKINHEQK